MEGMYSFLCRFRHRDAAGSAHRFIDSKPDKKPKSTAQIGGGIDQPEIRLRIYYNSGEVSLSLKNTRKTALKMKNRTRTEDQKSPGKSSISPDVGSGSRGSIDQYSSSVDSERSNHADESCDLLEIIEGYTEESPSTSKGTRKASLKTLKYRTRTEDQKSPPGKSSISPDAGNSVVPIDQLEYSNPNIYTERPQSICNKGMHDHQLDNSCDLLEIIEGYT
jgi:hypothetical protein